MGTKIFREKRLPLLVLIALLIPLFFISISKYHDWGDDHAQYIAQAKELVQAQSPAIKVLDNQNIGPSFRGSGFSLLLAPLYAIFGNDNRVFLFFITLLLSITGVLFFSYLEVRNNNRNSWWHVLLVLLFVYNFQVLQLKASVTSVFPLMLFLFCVLLLHTLKKGFLLQCVTLGFLCAVSNSAWAFYLGFLIFTFLQDLKTKHLISSTLVVFIPPLIYSLLQLIVFKSALPGEIAWYQEVFSLRPVFENIIYYKDAFLSVFKQEVPGWMNLILKTLTILLVLTGLVKNLAKNISLMDVLMLVYLALILCYPYTATGMRFFLPLIPFALIYLLDGLELLSSYLKWNKALVPGILLFFIASYFLHLKNSFTTVARSEYGPESTPAQEAFRYISQNTNNEDVIAFPKPYALYLYCERKAICIHPLMQPEEFTKNLETFSVNYVMIGESTSETELQNEGILNMLISDTRFKKIWSNTEFILFKVNPR